MHKEQSWMGEAIAHLSCFTHSKAKWKMLVEPDCVSSLRSHSCLSLMLNLCSLQHLTLLGVSSLVPSWCLPRKMLSLCNLYNSQSHVMKSLLKQINFVYVQNQLFWNWCLLWENTCVAHVFTESPQSFIYYFLPLKVFYLLLHGLFLMLSSDISMCRDLGQWTGT